MCRRVVDLEICAMSSVAAELISLIESSTRIFGDKSICVTNSCKYKYVFQGCNAFPCYRIVTFIARSVL